MPQTGAIEEMRLMLSGDGSQDNVGLLRLHDRLDQRVIVLEKWREEIRDAWKRVVWMMIGNAALIVASLIIQVILIYAKLSAVVK